MSLNALRGLALQVVPFGERISTPRIRGTSFLVPHFTPEPHHCYESRGTDNPLGTVPSSAGVTSRGGLRVPESWNQPPHKGGKRRVLQAEGGCLFQCRAGTSPLTCAVASTKQTVFEALCWGGALEAPPEVMTPANNSNYQFVHVCRGDGHRLTGQAPPGSCSG